LGTIPTFNKQEGALPGKRSKSLLGKTQPTLPAASQPTTSSSPAELVVKEYPRSAPSESFRMLLSNINFLSSDKPIKVIVISSCLPGEGKTTVSANLATCMAQMGRRVIVIDADMRRPYLHNCFGIPNKKGLSNVLVGESTLDASILPLEENLDVIPSGQMPPDPVALVSSKRMEALITGLAQSYDFVIIDTPPLSLTAESMILARMGDGVLLVTRPGVVDAEMIFQCKRALVQAGPKVLGLVVNGVIPENESSIYYQYYNSSYYGSDKTADSAKS
jgi:capsular exopolysaccharide synthesis family protein